VKERDFFVHQSLDEALDELMVEYGSAILKFIYSYVRNQQVAEDLSQEVFIKVYKSLHTYKGEAAIKTWLFRIAANQCKDYFKSWHSRKVRVSNFVETYLKANEQTPEQDALNKSFSNELTKAVLSLPIKYREVIILFYFEEMSQSEMSEVLQLNISTVKSRLAKSRALLRKEMSEYDKEGSLHELG
jgi:RNA polymerase sigma-70 factor, ECF subfamily